MGVVYKADDVTEFVRLRLRLNRMVTIKFALCRSLWLVLFLVFVGAADAQAPPPPAFCSSITITPDPLLIPADVGTFQHTVTTEPNPFCSCLWGSAYRVTFGRAVGFPDNLTDFPVLRGERVEEPAACVFDHTRVYEPNDGPTRTGIYGVWAKETERPIDFSMATATIEIIQAGVSIITLINPDPDPKEPLLIGGKQTFSAKVEIDLPEPLPGGLLQLLLVDTATDEFLARSPLTPLVGQTGMQMLTLPDVTLLEEGEFALEAHLFDEDRIFLGKTNSFIYTIGLDFEVLWIEVTQVIQDNGNNVPLVANKKTFARVYAKRNLPPGEPSEEQPEVPRLDVELTGARGGQELGQAKPIGPFTAEALPILAINIPVREASPITSAIFELPLAWTNKTNMGDELVLMCRFSQNGRADAPR